MASLRKLTAVLALSALLVTAASPAHAEFKTEASHAPPVFDALILRPAGVLFGLASIALFVPVAGVTLVTRPSDIGKPFEQLVMKPVRYVFIDPIGEH